RRSRDRLVRPRRHPPNTHRPMLPNRGHRMTRFAILEATTIFLVALSMSARADQAVPRDPAAGEALFRAARDRGGTGDWAAGCPKFEAAMAASPTASTLLNIARCHEHDGRVASAWVDAKRALVLNRETVPEERRRALEDAANQ